MNDILIHGFNVRDGGARTIDTFAPYLRSQGRNVDTDSADYGWHYLLKVRFRYWKDVHRIAVGLKNADCIWTHSNGANYAHLALELYAQWDPAKKFTILHFSPALNRNAPIPANVERMFVFATPHDRAVQVARMLILHRWGDMGRVGYKGSDPRVKASFIHPEVKHHSGWFRPNPDKFAKLGLEAIQ